MKKFVFLFSMLFLVGCSSNSEDFGAPPMSPLMTPPDNQDIFKLGSPRMIPPPSPEEQEQKDNFEELKKEARTSQIITLVGDCESDYWKESTNYLSKKGFYPIGNVCVTGNIDCILIFEKGVSNEE